MTVAPTCTMKIEGLIVRTGVPLPPPSGPARTAHCILAGWKRLAEAEKLFASAVVRLTGLLPGGWEASPSPLGLDEVGSGPVLAFARQQRVSTWFDQARELNALRKQAVSFGASSIEADIDRAEQASRAGLKAAADAYNFFEDAAWDIHPRTILTDDAGVRRGSLRDVLARSHYLTHALGDMVGGLFGCELKHKDGDWFDTCASSLLHVRLGQSMGFTARHECTVCGGNFAVCDHLRDLDYEVPVLWRRGGSCSACRSDPCEHKPGDLAVVRAASVMTDVELREVSLVPRPRDPLARITARQVEQQDVEGMVGQRVEPSMRLLGHSCMQQCEGFGSSDAHERVDWLSA